MPMLIALRTIVVAFQTAHRASERRTQRMQVSCSAIPTPDRRTLMASLAGLAASPLLLTAAPAEAKMVDKLYPIESLSSFQRKDLLDAFQRRAVAELRKVLTDADAPAALRLLLHDAATYDAVSKTGGCNGSVVLSEELNSPENADLKGVVAKLATAKQAVDAARPAGQQALSWADAIVLGVKVTQEQVWAAERMRTNPINGERIVAQFSNAIPVRLGRVDATSPDPSGRLPPASASAAKVLAFTSRLGVKDPAELEGLFAKKAPFWARPTFVLWPAAQPDPEAAEAALVAGAPDVFGSWKQQYDVSRASLTRTNYEIDFSNDLERLAALGATFDRDAYLYPVTVTVPDRMNGKPRLGRPS